MERRASAVALTALLAAALGVATAMLPRGVAHATEPEGPPPGYALALSFDEDFDGDKPSHDWGHVFADPGGGSQPITKRNLWSNGEQQVYVDPDYLKLGIDPLRVHDGMATISAAPLTPAAKAAVDADLDRQTPFRANPVLRSVAFSSGLLTQRGRFAQQYGYFEARLRWTAGKGVWPGFWLLRQDSHWPPEIDIMEAIGSKDTGAVFSSIHSALPTRDETRRVPLPGSPQDFHRYGAMWLPDRVDYYVDGIKTVSIATKADMNQPMYLLVNLAIGGNWPGHADATTEMPARLDIDYVRAWRFVGPPPS